ncbi:DNA adenine methylase [Latilactobacillus sakei]|nr:DNA adenine methylase [Latilactobacillus sakei]AUX11608.1 DNA adenine methylase [Latilactobacillus sakei]
MSITMSPFRYPGGKSQLYKFVEHLLEINHVENGTYIEAFAGGSGLAIKLLVEDKIDNIWINDYDRSIYSVWYAILNTPEQLIERINQVPFDYQTGSVHSDEYNIEYWNEIRSLYLQNNTNAHSIDNAFATLFLNRTNRSGIITGGPIGGKMQLNTKIYARFNKNTLIRKINLIHSLKDRIRLTQLDALKLIPIMQQETDTDNTFIFFDPPYYDQGSNLYFSSFNHEDHSTMARSILSLNDYKWITTYDNVTAIREIYANSEQRFEYDIRYTANNSKRGMAKEVMYSNNLTMLESYANIILREI